MLVPISPRRWTKQPDHSPRPNIVGPICPAEPLDAPDARRLETPALHLEPQERNRHAEAVRQLFKCPAELLILRFLVLVHDATYFVGVSCGTVERGGMAPLNRQHSPDISQFLNSIIHDDDRSGWLGGSAVWRVFAFSTAEHESGCAPYADARIMPRFPRLSPLRSCAPDRDTGINRCRFLLL